MTMKHAIWKVGAQPLPLHPTLISEQQLEEMIVRSPEILSGEWMLIGQQEQTGLGGRIDLLAIAPDASLVLIELKRNKTPREIVAQAIDYASWVEQLTTDKIAQIYQRFSKGGNLDEAFQKRFKTELDEETLNESHQIIIVAAELDAQTERIITYLNARDIAINVLFFQVFQYGADQLLSRAWLLDLSETQANVVATTKSIGEKEPWNGEFYVSFGGDCTWEDARKYGFISAGGGTWYTQTLKLLEPGDRVWIKVPGTGYVGVGRVTETAQSVHEFKVKTSEGDRLALEVLSTSDKLRTRAADPALAEYFVRVEWLQTLPLKEAFDPIGLFGNQNTVCKPTTPKWRHTVEQLKTRFKGWDRLASSGDGSAPKTLAP
jgi:hypothetical protein